MGEKKNSIYHSNVKGQFILEIFSNIHHANCEFKPQAHLNNVHLISDSTYFDYKPFYHFTLEILTTWNGQDLDNIISEKEMEKCTLYWRNKLS